MEESLLPDRVPVQAPAAVPAAGYPTPVAQPELPQGSLLRVVWRRRWVVLLALAVCLGGGFAHLWRATPLYTSTSRLYVEQRGPKILSEGEGVLTRGYNYVQTQSELLKSTSILADAAEKLRPARLRTLGQGTNLVGLIRAGLSVEVGRKDDIINVSFEGPHPEEAAQVANAVVDAYVTFHSKTKRNTAAEVLRILRTEKAKRDAEFSEKLKALMEFKEANPALLFEVKGGNIIVEGLSRLSDALNAAHLETINARAAHESIKSLADDPEKIRAFLEVRRAGGAGGWGSQAEARSQAELELLRAQLLEARTRVTDSHPLIETLQRRITEAERRLAEAEKKAVEAELAAATERLRACEARETQIRKSYEEQRQQAIGLNAQIARFTMLQSELDQTKKLCDLLDQRIKEMDISEEAGALYITVLEVASPSYSPSSPNRVKVMSIALVFGLMLGVGLALGLDFLDQRFHSADEITATLGTPLLGIVPQMPGSDGLVEHGRAVEKEPTSHAAESYRTVRTAIYFGVPNGHAKSLLITSPAPGDGKTTLTSNLGIAMAQAGQRTLIVDGDFRKPMQHAIFEIEREHGLSGVLAGRETLDAAIHHTKVECLDILPTGPTPPNPSEMLNSQAFADLLKELRERYDHILIDSPPVMPVTDARILGALCDVTILVLRAEKSHRKVAERARDALLGVGAQILGTVVNAVPRREDRYYHYSGYGYYYRRGYGYGYGYGSKRKKSSADQT